MWGYRRPDSAVDVATSYGLNGPAIVSRWGRNFPQMFTTALGPTQTLVRWVMGLIRVSFSGVKRQGRGVKHRPPSSAGVKQIADVHIHSPLSTLLYSGPSWHVIV
jgi:hypothetical protein